MGRLIDGRWVSDEAALASKDGRYRRAETTFRDWIKADGSTAFRPEVGRYHLYVSYACPWAHRTLIFRTLKGLESAISVSVVDPFMGSDGWWFSGDEGAGPDHLHGARYLHEVYTAALPDYTGRVSVPVLWDKETSTIVSNESAEIIRMLNTEFVGIAGNDLDFSPPDLRLEIDSVNDLVYRSINNGVYRAGFAGTQEAYEEAVGELFGTLDQLEDRLHQQRYVTGSSVTEADWRLFTTLVRFDAVYVTLFKCNQRRVADYPALSGYLHELYQWPGLAETVRFDHIKPHYFKSLTKINPLGIIPVGPTLSLNDPHGRDHLASSVRHVAETELAR